MKHYIIHFKPSSKVLEVGGGVNPLRDGGGTRITTNMDIQKNINVDIVHDLSIFPWPIEDASYGGLFTKYCLEHLSWHDIEKAISEMHRILSPGGKVVVLVPNTLEQAKRIVKNGVTSDTVEMLFGSQEFPDHGGSHKTGFSPDYAKKLFKNAGFNFVKTFQHPQTITDMIVEAYKIDEVFERQYFEDGTIGYKNYRDFATHYSAVRNIMKHKPESLLDVGGGRGYIVKILEKEGVKSVCMDISKHCWHSRVTDSFILHDATKIPWQDPKIIIIHSGEGIPVDKTQEEIDNEKRIIKDKEFDICFSINFLEHLSENQLDNVIKEMARVSKRGLHGIHYSDPPYEETDPDIDITHQIIWTKKQWMDKFKTVAPDYPVIIEHPRIFEYERPEKQPPVSLMPTSQVHPDDLVKLNIGSFLDCFYYGWINIDILDLSEFAKDQSYFFQQHDVTKGLPYQDNTVDLIMSNHLIEHLTRDEGKQFLRECRRVLKLGGIIRISTPDTFQLTKNYHHGDIWEYRYINVGVEQAEDDAEAYYNLLLAGHKTIYDEKALVKILEKTGFKNIKRPTPFESRSETIRTQTITTHPTISLVLEAEK